MRPTFLCCTFVCALAVLAPRAAHADPPAKSDVATDKARELHLEADTLYKQGQYARARVSYIAAWALKKHWQIAGSLGDTEVKLGLYRDAAEHLAYFMRLSPSQPPSAEAQKLVRVARSKIGTLTVSVDVPGAEVAVDGTVIGKAPLEDPVFVEPGHHTLEARLGAKLKGADVDVAAGSERAVPLALTPTTALPGGGSMQPAGVRKPLIITGAVLAGAGVVMGTAFALVSNAKASDAAAAWKEAVAQRGPSACAEATAPGCQNLYSLNGQKSTFGSAAAWSFIGGGAVGAATIVYALVAPRSAALPVQVTPVVTGQQGGLMVGGAW